MSNAVDWAEDEFGPCRWAQTNTDPECSENPMFVDGNLSVDTDRCWRTGYLFRECISFWKRILSETLDSKNSGDSKEAGLQIALKFRRKRSLTVWGHWGLHRFVAKTETFPLPPDGKTNHLRSVQVCTYFGMYDLREDGEIIDYHINVNQHWNHMYWFWIPWPSQG